jgi:HTH-type transcriptional regulator, glycine betaine synthesis regulator
MVAGFSIFSEIWSGPPPPARRYSIMAPQPSDRLLEAQDRFIAAWGQMGAAWGISRTMAEVHALLYISGQPMNTDDVMERLQISRGNASMSLRALLDWGIVFRNHKRGDRKEYYTAEQDVWALIRAIVRERMKREVDPLLASLFEIRDMTSPARSRGTAQKPLSAEEIQALVEHNKRLDSLLEFLQTLEKLSERFASPSGRGLRLAATILNKVS